MINGIDFEWSRAHTYEIARDESSSARRVIRQIGGGKDPIRPLELPSKKLLAVEFSELDGSQEQCLRFARAYGLLTKRAGKGPEFFDGPNGWQFHIKRMRAVINATELAMHPPRSRRIHMPLATVNIGLVSGLPGARPTFILQPTTLWEAMIVQFAQFKASGNEMVICEECREWFERGINGKRSDARFCSRRCQNKSYYRKGRAGK